MGVSSSTVDVQKLSEDSRNRLSFTGGDKVDECIHSAWCGGLNPATSIRIVGAGRSLGRWNYQSPGRNKRIFGDLENGASFWRGDGGV